MEMEVLPPVDFNFDSACSSPYITAPSSPQPFGNFFLSAPTSPRSSSAAAFLRQFNDLSLLTSAATAIGTGASSSPTPKSKNNLHNCDEDDDGDGQEDFAFDFSGQLERPSLSADELFDGGKIKPLKPPPERSDSSSLNKSEFLRRRKEDAAFLAAEETRERRSARKGKHSQSQSQLPFRVADLLDSRTGTNRSGPKQPSSSSNSSSGSSSSSAMAPLSPKGYRKWRLKDFLLFRSSSEGRVASKDVLRKYSALSKKSEDARNSSFRSADGEGSVSGSRRRGPVSAHELHYTANRAVSEEMRKKTFLPYKQDLLGCLGFGHGVKEISRGIGSLTRG
ncbi:uncharacterized protein LOC131155372 [Malania oleifera]|uniref:uncharacterized protein LOC131155372 n=1 Tax=Malania oleifera TaxID=397392 RepID=UPI0025ADEC9D|nr:uncharacterized protein LOC131155372 [Malania oleifera]